MEQALRIPILMLAQKLKNLLCFCSIGVQANCVEYPCLIP